MRFTFEQQVSVRPPYRLDLTVDALRRLAANVVDVVDEAGTFRRALHDGEGTNVIEVTQTSGRSLLLRVAGKNGGRWVPVVETMLGTRVRLEQWYENVRPFRWLDVLSHELVGLRPPRYPSLWEAFAHAIVFQQISIHAAAAIMRRTVETLGDPVEIGGSRYYPFMTPQSIAQAPDRVLRAAGLSQNKVAHLRSAAEAVLTGTVSAPAVEALPSPAAAELLCTVRGIGPWSAAVVLLRGLGRLDVFPMKDSGVARSIRLLSGGEHTDAHALLDRLGPVRGMLYFHLLLGRIRNLVPSAPDSQLV